MDLNYQQTKSQILRETNVKIEKHVEEELYKKRMELINGKPTIEQINTINVKGQVTCYKCGNVGHYARDG